VGACVRAAAHDHLEVAALVLMTLTNEDDAKDASVAENLRSIMQDPLLRNTLVCELPYGTPEAICARDPLKAIAAL
jgi:hypothetical protein